MEVQAFYTALVTFNHSQSCQANVQESQLGLLKFYRIIGLLLGPINALLNGICVHIFQHSTWKKSAMSRILKGLSIIELCMGIILFLHALMEHNSVDQNDPITETSDTLKDSSYKYLQTIVSFLFSLVISLCLLATQVARNWSVVLLAAYRYDRICRPIGTGTAFPSERICVILIAVAVFSCLVVLPRLFEFGIIICKSNGAYANSIPLLIQDRIYQIVYLGVVMFVVQSGGPVICVCVLSAFVIRLIAKRRRIHQQNENKSARRILQRQATMRTAQHQQLNDGDEDGGAPRKSSSGTGVTNANNNGCPLPLTHGERPSPSGDKLIFAVCITFFILETPAFFSKILNPYLEKEHPHLDMWLSVIANVLIYLDSTLNAFVYMASNPTFRKIAADELTRYKHQIVDRTTSTNSTLVELRSRRALDEEDNA